MNCKTMTLKFSYWKTNIYYVGSIWRSIWAVGLPVCPPVRLPSLACTRAPRKPRPRRRCPSRLFRPAARRLPPVPAARDRPSIQATPVVTHRDSPILICRLSVHSTVPECCERVSVHCWPARLVLVNEYRRVSTTAVLSRLPLDNSP